MLLRQCCWCGRWTDLHGLELKIFPNDIKHLAVHTRATVELYNWSFEQETCAWCYSKRGAAKTGNSEQHLLSYGGFTSSWWQSGHYIVYSCAIVNATTIFVVVGWPWQADGRGSRLRRQGSQPKLWSAIILLPRDALPTRYMLSSCVCTSVCPSITSRSSTKTAKPKIT